MLNYYSCIPIYYNPIHHSLILLLFLNCQLQHLLMQGKQLCREARERIIRDRQQNAQSIGTLGDRMQKLLIEKQQTLQTYITKFQNQVKAINRSREKQSINIQRLKGQLNERKVLSQLVQKAYCMQEDLLQKMKENMERMQQFNNGSIECLNQYESMEHRQELELEKYARKRQDGRMKSSSKIELDREKSKITLNIDPAKGKVFDIFYNKKDDRFWVSEGNRTVTQAVSQFNFHRNMAKLYQALDSI